MSSKAQTREKDYERGLRIADRRKTMGLSQDELAHRVGMGRQALSAIENGGDFKVSVLRKIAVVLNCSSVQRRWWSRLMNCIRKSNSLKQKYRQKIILLVSSRHS